MTKKKKRKRKNNNNKIFLIAVCVAFLLMFLKIEEKGVKVTVKDQSAMLSKEEIKILEDYRQCYGKTLLELNPQDISHLYADTSGKSYNLNQTALKVISSIRSLSDKDLKLDYVKIEYTVKNIEYFGDSIKVYLTENNVQKFKHLKHPSHSYNLNHWFTLEFINGKVYIKNHEHEEDFYLLTQEAWQNINEQDNFLKSEKVLQILKDDANENLIDLEQFQQGGYVDDSLYESSYNRKRAVEYAKKWPGKRNTEYSPYDELGGNCQNFASQCLYAGGIQMDTSGPIELQWKYYGDTLNPGQTPTGRSYSWTGVDMFYTYAKHNTENGLLALVDANYDLAMPGDVIHVGAYGDWRHALFITDVIKKHNQVDEIIVSSNTADRVNYPLSAYIYTAKRLIHILGQN